MGVRVALGIRVAVGNSSTPCIFTSSRSISYAHSAPFCFISITFLLAGVGLGVGVGQAIIESSPSSLELGSIQARAGVGVGLSALGSSVGVGIGVAASLRKIVISYSALSGALLAHAPSANKAMTRTNMDLNIPPPNTLRSIPVNIYPTPARSHPPAAPPSVIPPPPSFPHSRESGNPGCPFPSFPRRREPRSPPSPSFPRKSGIQISTSLHRQRPPNRFVVSPSNHATPYIDPPPLPPAPILSPVCGRELERGSARLPANRPPSPPSFPRRREPRSGATAPRSLPFRPLPRLRGRRERGAGES